jgi:hypothetical protein
MWSVAGAVEKLDQTRRERLSRVRRDEAAKRHATHLSAHELAKMHAGDPQPRHAGRDPLCHEGIGQKRRDPAGIDMRAVGHGRAAPRFGPMDMKRPQMGVRVCTWVSGRARP